LNLKIPLPTIDIPKTTDIKTVTMAPSNLPSIFNATSQDIEMLLAAQCHLGSKNLQVHMEPYLWKTRPDGINVINIGKTWYGFLLDQAANLLLLNIPSRRYEGAFLPRASRDPFFSTHCLLATNIGRRSSLLLALLPQ